MPVSPYIHFPGTCRDALALYARAFGGEPHILLRSEAPEGTEPESTQHLVMHGTLEIHGTTVMLADSLAEALVPSGDRISLMVNRMAREEIDRAFAVLAEGGEVLMTPQITFWSPWYGQLIDRYGLVWQLSAED
ncbi:MAG: VOC family protein [Chloroflexi bacterium]|nr:VOC family protein [Chloroflexota bacterium]